MSSYYPSRVLDRGRAVLEAWKKIDTNLTFGALTPEAMAAEIEQARSLLAQIDATEAQLTDLRNQRHAACAGVWDKVKRVRAAMKGVYGDDSSEYEMVGGTRRSERKRPGPKS